MRNTLSILLLPLYIWFTVSGISAQQTFPIYVTASLTPPYSLTLSDYSQIGSQRLVVTIMVKDVTITNLPVRLNLKMETTNGVTIETIPNIAVAPIFLTGGEGLVLFGDDMRDYFNINNLQFKGYSKDEYRRTGQLPEGFYRFTVEVRHFNTGRLISNQGTAITWIAQGKPPVLKIPDNGEEMGQITGMPLTFSWIPSPVAVPNVVTQYTFEMWEMRVPGIPPAVVAASMPVFYSATQMTTSLSIIPTTLPFEPGMNYAWRVTASDAMGQVQFAQDGRSEVRTFVYQCRCDSVTGFRVERQGQDVTYRWTPDKNHTSFNVELENPVSKWSKSERFFDAKYQFKSDPDKTYRMRVQAICKNNETNPSDFTAWQTVVIPAIKTDAEICPDCECGKEFPDIPLTNFTLRTDLQPGDTIITRRGDSRLIIKSVIPQGNGVYKGQFLLWVRIWGIKFLMDYWDLKVNTDNRIVYMNAKSVNDPNFVLDVDAAKDYLNQLGDAVATLTTNTTIKDTVQVNGSLNGAYVNEKGELVDASGNPIKTVPPLSKPNGTLLQGSDGEEYVMNSDGKMVGKDEFAETGGNSRLVDNYNKEKEEKAQPSIVFSASPQQQWGFDAYNKDIKSAIQSEYPELKPGSGYRPSFKSLESFKLDKVLTNGNSSITYRTEMGIAPMQSGEMLTVRGGSDGDETILYAYSKKDSTEMVVGKLNLLSFNEKTKTVYLVSVNNAQLPDVNTLKTELDRIFAPAIMKWNVIAKPGIQVTFPGGNMTHGGSGALSVYNSDQKKVIKAYGQMEKDVYYLFFVDNVQGRDGSSDFAGYMPLQYQSGFIYGSTNATDIAHELAHGAFSLYHTFSSDKFISAQNTTDNLMDYSRGVELWKYQWKEIHNPKNSWLKFLQDEEEGEGAIISGLKIPDEYKNPDKKSVTFYTPALTPITLPASVASLTFSTGDAMVDGVSKTDTYHTPIGSLIYFTLNEKTYIYRGDQTSFYGYGLDGSTEYYIDDISKSLIKDYQEIKPLIAFPYFENNKMGYDLLKCKNKAIIDNNLENAINSDSYTGKGMASKNIAAILNELNLSNLNFKIEQGAIITADFYPALTSTALEFLKRHQDLTGLTSLVAPIVIAHAQQISRRPIYDNCLQDIFQQEDDRLETELLLKGQQIQSNPYSQIEGAINYDKDSYNEAFMKYEEWSTKSITQYKEYEDIVAVINKGILEQDTPDKMLAYFKKYFSNSEDCLYDEIEWKQRHQAITLLVKKGNSDCQKYINDLIYTTVRNGQSSLLYNALKANNYELFWNIWDKMTFKDFATYVQTLSTIIVANSQTSDIDPCLIPNIQYSIDNAGSTGNIQNSTCFKFIYEMEQTGWSPTADYYARSLNNGEIGLYGQLKNLDKTTPLFEKSEYEPFEIIKFVFPKGNCVSIGSDITENGTEFYAPAFYGAFIINNLAKKDLMTGIRILVDGVVIVSALPSGGSSLGVAAAVEISLSAADIVIQLNSDELSQINGGTEILEAWDNLYLTGMIVADAPAILKAGSRLTLKTSEIIANFKSLSPEIRERFLVTLDKTAGFVSKLGNVSMSNILRTNLFYKLAEINFQSVCTLASNVTSKVKNNIVVYALYANMEYEIATFAVQGERTYLKLAGTWGNVSGGRLLATYKDVYYAKPLTTQLERGTIELVLIDGELVWREVVKGGDAIGTYTTTIKWGENTIEARPFGKGYWGKRFTQSDVRVNAYELKVNPNNESFYLWNSNENRFVQFENISGNMLQDGKCVLTPNNSIYRVYDKEEFLRQNILKQAQTQVETAQLHGLKVEWLVSDEVAVEQLQRFFNEKNLDIIVKYLPE